MGSQQSKLATYNLLKRWFIINNSIGYVDVATKTPTEITEWCTLNLSKGWHYDSKIHFDDVEFIKELLQIHTPSNYDPVIIPLIRNTLPGLVAQSLLGVMRYRFWFLNQNDLLVFKMFWG